MSFLKLNGIEVLIAPGEAGYSNVLFGGELKRAFSGRLINASRGQKREWELTTAALPNDDAESLVSLLTGAGHSWSFDDDTWSSKGVQAVLNSNRSATFEGGRYGNALSLSTQHNESLRIAGVLEAGEGTIMGWFYFNDNSISPFLTTGPSFSLSKLSDGRIQYIELYFPSTLTARTVRPVKANDWNHLVFSWGPKGRQLYLNGSLEIANSVQSPLPVDANQRLTINAFNGKLDDLVLLPYTLSPRRVRELFVAGVPFDTARLLAHGTLTDNRPVYVMADRVSSKWFNQRATHQEISFSLREI